MYNDRATILDAAETHPSNLDEHLMIMFYDILLLDDIVCVRESHDKRRGLLESLVYCIPGRADIGIRNIVDFLSSDAPELLREAFARAITQR